MDSLEKFHARLKQLIAEDGTKLRPFLSDFCLNLLVLVVGFDHVEVIVRSGYTVQIVHVGAVEQLSGGEPDLPSAVRNIVLHHVRNDIADAVTVHSSRCQNINLGNWHPCIHQRFAQPVTAGESQCWAIGCQ